MVGLQQPPYTCADAANAATIARLWANFGLEVVYARIEEAGLPLSSLRDHVKSHAAFQLSCCRAEDARRAYEGALLTGEDVTTRAAAYVAAKAAVLPMPPRIPRELELWLSLR